MRISTADARGLYTKMLIAVYRERVTPMSFLRSFFKVTESTTLEISIDVQRGTERIAVDVQRGTEGNRNSFNKSTEKIFVPPYYREYFEATELELYNALFVATEIDADVFAEFVNSVADKLRLLQDKIERSYELQCAQVLLTGVVTLEAGTNIDFKRKAGSMVDKGAGQYWTTGSVDPDADMEAAAKFIRETGKAQGEVVNMIAGGSAFTALKKNDTFKAKNNLFNLRLDSIHPPQRNAVGASLHGQISAGSYLFNLWTYPEAYESSPGTMTPYIDPKKVIFLPENPKFNLAFAGVPQLLTSGGIVPVKGAFKIGDYIDERLDKHVFDIKSAGVAVPVAVDQIYTLKVIA